jgi:hypothetical protein
MTDKDWMGVLRSMMLSTLDLQEQVLGLRLAIAENLVIPQEKVESALDRAKALWKPAREQVQKLGTEESQTLADILSTFEGPVQ